MDIYLFTLILGAVGLLAMAAAGLGRHGHSGGGSHGHGGHGHGGHGHGGHGHGGHGHNAHASGGATIAGWILMSPRMMFAALLGFGVAGTALRTWIGGTVLILAAIAVGIVVERVVVNPLWNYAMRFASNPANTLASATFGEAVAVSSFDKNGQGIVSIEVDGHVQQILATLQRVDRDAGVRIRAGQTVRIEEVDEARQRCTVSKPELL